MNPYRILERKRAGRALSEEEIRAVVAGAVDGSWGDDRLAAFLMATAIRGLDPDETRTLTIAMLESGERWALASEVERLSDKHSTGGVGDKVSLVLSPLLAACGYPVIMLTGRGLGHTAGTADKLETIPGLDLALDRRRSLGLLERVGVAIGVATNAVAPADQRLYALRDRTATVDSLELITASILSKKLATGAGSVVFDVKTGNGAFLVRREEGERLARLLVDTCRELGTRASALLTDMSQPLGTWVGHAAEVWETMVCLGGEGPPDLMAVVERLALETAALWGEDAGEGSAAAAALERAIASGAAREIFLRWVEAQGGDPAWLERAPELAPVEAVVEAPRTGVLAGVDTRRLGLLLAEAGGGRILPGAEIDGGVSMRYAGRLGQPVEAGQELARLYLRRDDSALRRSFAECFRVAEAGEAPELIRSRIA